MKNDIFKASDFEESAYRGRLDGLVSIGQAASTANKILNEWVEKNGVKVWACQTPAQNTLHWAQPADASHEAMLINIEPIEKPKCEHKKVGLAMATPMGITADFVCRDCGKYLEPLGWKESE